MKKADGTELRDWWLNKFHNTNSKEVLEKYPDSATSPIWFDYYPVTTEQYDEWKAWAKKHLREKYKIPVSMIERGFGMIELDLAPKIIDEQS